MILSTSERIAEIDRYAECVLGISTTTLMGRAGLAVANAVKEHLQQGSSVIILAGKGNNGGDGYAAAVLLNDEYNVTVIDVFSAGQRSEAGKHYLSLAQSAEIPILPLEYSDFFTSLIAGADCIIDAIFGTGCTGEYPEIVKHLSSLVGASPAFKIAVDVPLGVSADLGTVSPGVTYRQDATVALSFVKPCLVSYPAKEYAGKLIFDNLGLPLDALKSNFTFLDYCIDYDLACSFMPKRADNTNKGSFGKLLVCCGSREYKGAPRLSLEGALRSGAGLVSFIGERELTDSLLSDFPEVIYHTCESSDLAVRLTELSSRHTATLIGSGSGKSECLRLALRQVTSSAGGALILDADALNLIADDGEDGIAMLNSSPREIIITPHPLEMARLLGTSVDFVQNNRISVARDFAKRAGVTLILKGAATVVTDGYETYINSSGSSALAKAGSGDVLAAVIASLVASGMSPLRASALAVWVHGAAADALALLLSQLGVTPSDLPREIARQLRKLESHQEI